MPGFVSLRGMSRFGTEPAGLGLAHRPVTPEGPARENLSLPKGVSAERVADRRDLLARFDTLRRDIDKSGSMDGMDAYTAQAFDMIASGAVRKDPVGGGFWPRGEQRGQVRRVGSCSRAKPRRWWRSLRPSRRNPYPSSAGATTAFNCASTCRSSRWAPPSARPHVATGATKQAAGYDPAAR